MYANKTKKKKIIEVAKNNQEQDWTNNPKSIQDQDCTHKQGNGESSTSGNRKQSSSIVIVDSWRDLLTFGASKKGNYI